MAASMHLPAGGHNRRFSSEAARDGHESREEIDQSASCFQIETASLSRRITVAVDELSCGPAGEGTNSLAIPCDRSIDLKELVVDELALGPVRSVIGVRMRTRTSRWSRICQ